VTDDDVPSPIDFQSPTEAREWERTAMEKRPWRIDMFAHIADELGGRRRVLELGSGPGFLAAHLLGRLDLEYVALDVSAAMHELARVRLGSRATFVERDFLDPSWSRELGTFDAVVTMQAVHELRHKRRAPALYAQARELLAPGGLFLVCDHVVGDGGMTNESLYMTEAEQLSALHASGFTDVRLAARMHGLALIAASL
jgi:cyclopropane fatty-acyl-phospholipid synthase-like methyltransferase